MTFTQTVMITHCEKKKDLEMISDDYPNYR